MSHEVTLAKYCEGKNGNVFCADGYVRGSRGLSVGSRYLARRVEGH